ncbi:SGNH/GDSL hydrolase family protein [Mesomycoplasma hyorhinis]|uniref:SGNH/GDSL hydrolase family protein n=1 Tax=Mesomycoplasma hyorhinis TaxID=2100 RepID=UPI001C05D963|nr:SGNH/GDSL hydrolase family protein [Mesomycoplasma hyorhinis]
MLRKAIKLKILAGSLAAATGVTITSIAIYSAPTLAKKEATKTNLNNSVSKNQNQLIDKVNYLAIGDSITAGFNLESGNDIRGNFKDNHVRGLSYPAYLANYIQMVKKDALVSFDNLALSGSTIRNWLYLLEPSRKNEANQNKEILKFTLELDKQTNNHFADVIKSVFNDFESTSYPKLIQKVKDSNLITLSLGANDLILSLDYELLSQINNEKHTLLKQQLINQFKQSQNDKLEQVRKNLAKLILLIKKINPKTNINLIGYSENLTTVASLFSSMLENSLNLDKDYIIQIIKKLNETIKEVAAQTKVNYINVYDKQLWEANKKEWLKNDLDIHPSTFGYKKMAQEIFLKLSLKQNQKSQLFSLIPYWNENYLTQDNNSYKQQIDFKLTNEQIIKKLVRNKTINNWTKQATELDKLSEIEFFKANKTATQAWKSILYAYLVTNTSVLNKVVDGSDLNSEIKENIKSFFKDKNFPSFLQEVLSTKLVSNFIASFESYVLQANEKQTFESLINYVKNKGLNDKDLIAFLQSILNSKLITENKEQFKSVVLDLLFINKHIINFVFSKFNLQSQLDTKTVNAILGFQSFYEFFKQIVDELIDHKDEYLKINQLSDIFQIFLSKEENIKKLKQFFVNFSGEMLKNDVVISSIIKWISVALNVEIDQSTLEQIVSTVHQFSDQILNTKLFSVVQEKFTSEIISVLNSATKEELYNFKVIDKIIERSKKVASSLVTEETFTTLLNDLHNLNINVSQLNIIKEALLPLYDFLTNDQTKKAIYNFADIKDENLKELISLSLSYLSKNNSIQDTVELILDDFFINHKKDYDNLTTAKQFLGTWIKRRREFIERIIYNFINENIQNQKFSSILKKIISSNEYITLSDSSQRTLIALFEALLKRFPHENKKIPSVIQSTLDQFWTAIITYLRSNEKNFDNFDKYFSISKLFPEENVVNLLREISFISKDSHNPDLTIDKLFSLGNEVLRSDLVKKLIFKYINFHVEGKTVEESQGIFNNLYDTVISSASFKSFVDLFIKYASTFNVDDNNFSITNLLKQFLTTKKDEIKKAFKEFTLENIKQPYIHSLINSIIHKNFKSLGIDFSDDNVQTILDVIRALLQKDVDNEVHKIDSSYRPLKTVNLILDEIHKFLIAYLDNKKDFKVDFKTSDIINLILDFAQIVDNNEFKSNNYEKLASVVRKLLKSDIAKNQLKQSISSFSQKYNSLLSKELYTLVDKLIDSNRINDVIKLVFDYLKNNKQDLQNEADHPTGQSFSSLFVKFLTNKKEDLKKIVKQLIEENIDTNEVRNLFKKVFEVELKVQISPTETDFLIYTIKELISGKHKFIDVNSALSNKSSFDIVLDKIFDLVITKLSNKPDAKISFTSQEMLHFLKELLLIINQTSSTQQKNNLVSLVNKLLKSEFVDQQIAKLDLSFLDKNKYTKNTLSQTQIRPIIKDIISWDRTAKFVDSLVRSMNLTNQEISSLKSVQELIPILIRKHKQLFKDYLYDLLAKISDYDQVGNVFVNLIKDQLKLTQLTRSEDKQKIKDFVKNIAHAARNIKLVSSIIDKLVVEFSKNNQEISISKISSILSSIFADKNFLSTEKIFSLIDAIENPHHPDPKNPKIKIQTLVNFLDLIFITASDWNNQNNTKKENISPILNHFNTLNPKHQAISWTGQLPPGDFGSGTKINLNKIGIFVKYIYDDFKLRHVGQQIRKDNYRRYPEGRMIYRLTAILLLTVWEELFRDASSIVQVNGFWKEDLNAKTGIAEVYKYLTSSHNNDIKNLIKAFYGKYTPTGGWLFKSWRNNTNYLKDDLVPMVYWSGSADRFERHVYPRIKDRIIHQIRNGHDDNH